MRTDEQKKKKKTPPVILMPAIASGPDGSIYRIFKGKDVHTRHQRHHHECSCRWLILMAARMSDRRPDDDCFWHGQATRSPRGFWGPHSLILAWHHWLWPQRRGNAEGAKCLVWLRRARVWREGWSWFTSVDHLLYLFWCGKISRLCRANTHGQASLFDSKPPLSWDTSGHEITQKTLNPARRLNHTCRTNA